MTWTAAISATSAVVAAGKSSLLRLKNIGLILFSVSLLLTTARAGAEPNEVSQAEQIHWSLASFFGTGWYRAKDNRSTFILNIPIAKTIDTPKVFGLNETDTTFKLLFPVSVGIHHLDDASALIDFETYSSLAFVPGAEMNIPMTDRWTLKPIAHFGWGYEEKSDDLVSVWYVGLRNRYMLTESGGNSVALLGSLTLGGNKPQYEQRSRYGALLAGFEGTHRIKSNAFTRRPLNFYWNGSYATLFDELDFHLSPNLVNRVDDQWELGAGIGKAGKAVSWWLFSFDRLGLAYQQSSDGVYKAVKIFFSSAFDR